MSNVEARVDALQRRIVAVEQKAERLEESFSPRGHYGLLITRHDKMLYVYSSLATVAVMFAAGAVGWLFSAMYELKGDVSGLRASVTTLERSVGRVEDRLGALETRMDGLESRMGGLEAQMERFETEVKQMLADLRAELRAPRAGGGRPSTGGKPATATPR